MASISQISEILPQFLVDISGVMDEVQVVDVGASEEEQPDDVDNFEEQEWDDAETDTENDDDEMQYKLDDDDEDIDDEEDRDEDDEYDRQGSATSATPERRGVAFECKQSFTGGCGGEERTYGSPLRVSLTEADSMSFIPTHGWMHAWDSPFWTRSRSLDSTKMQVCKHPMLETPLAWKE
ncbi:hypothetical protein Cgig2_020165 [Carnegiea gigantea]|uniref:Uncharacterized protein n=1 Tax=Carnegiea gigantea TaxID=171969 RepID=A0A9Q1KX56_9CARY|nr:hypothetical protein Cgig2_020165 [Carnegiea gigantea]